VSDDAIRDLTDEEARRALPTKWGLVDADVLPSWVAEMDFAPAPVVAEAARRAAADMVFGYPSDTHGGPLGEAYARFAGRRHGWVVDPDQVIPVSDVTAGIRLLIEVLSEPGPVVVPTPAYPPQLEVPDIAGRELVTVPLSPDAAEAVLDVDGIDAALAAGARTVILTQPHNPLGRVYRRHELEGLRDVVARHGARVVSDEVHAPLVLPGGPDQVPYLSIPGTGEHATAVVSASKAFNTPGLRCAQMVTDDAATHQRLRSQPLARNDAWASVGVEVSVAAYEDGDGWLDSLLSRLVSQRALLGQLLAEHLPLARMRPVEATYLAWLDLREYGVDDPAELAHQKGRVRFASGHDFQPGLTGHLRLNLATSPARLTEAVRRLASALRP